MQEKKKNWVPTSYLQEEDKIRRRVFFVLRVAQFKNTEDFSYDKLPTRAMEVRDSQGSCWVRQGWSNATEESVGKLGREKKETKEGEKVAPAKAMFRMSQTKFLFFFLVHKYKIHLLCVGWRNLPLLHVGWRNLFSSCAVVSVFGSGGK